ncbi:VWA domain-containing protein [Galbitalea sp. SE-J8]|uniref:vWA domain-containing protein n=1 Tax=Galbitalea sp. SE-J8 TaxID=3054952 RepID=UPI00259CC6AD|nr:VWA domain-containing protein [Galbitalea sp. SE-J8]MDM4763500.1 VWA domain-containing protein [Galbitalea sp. SE-J8]
MIVLQGWLAPVWLVAAAGAIALAIVLVRRRRDRRADADVPVAHSERLTALPGYRRSLRRYTVLLSALAAVVLVGFVAASVLTLRLAVQRVDRTDPATRDIVLCLDVSGSMVDYDSEVVGVFSDLAKRFEGERLSLVLFNASAVTYFPLTSDLSYIEAQFARLQGEFASPEQSYFDGTLFGDGSSLVGDGLASCVTRFPDAAAATDADAGRSRSVILVTDNLVAGKQVFSLPEAGDLARDRGVRVYGINPGDTESEDYIPDIADEFRSVVTASGGAYYALDDPDAIPDIVRRIEREQARVTAGPMRVVIADAPALAAWAALLALVAASVLGWAVRR